MVTRSRQAKDSDLGASLFAGNKPLLATLPAPPPAPPAAAPVQNISGLFGGTPVDAGGIAPGEVGSDEWALNTGGPGAMLWRAIASGGVYNALDWAGKNPGALESNDTILKAAKKELK